MSKREFVDYRGERFYLQTSGAYFQSGDKSAPERLLHRRVYIDNFGPIPPGFDVHHKDDDWRNSDPDNLEALPQPEHRRHHMAERRKDPAERAMMDAALGKAREAARAWHASPEGVQWHKAAGVASWEDREPIPRNCDRCGAAYGAWVPGGRFCSRKCISDNANAALFDTPRNCVVCGAGFMAHRYRQGKTCSPVCAGEMRRASGVLRRG